MTPASTATTRAPKSAESGVREQLLEKLNRQRTAFKNEGVVTAEMRIDRINRCIDLIVDNVESIADALDKDYGCRSRRQSRYAEGMFTLASLKHARKKVRKWMRPSKRPTMFPMNLMGGRSKVVYQPLGVVGVIGPWNFPVHLTLGPLAGIFAAGNRCLMKPSEFTPRTSDLLGELVDRYFDETELTVVTGGPETGAAFSSLPFDHLLFTGGTAIGRHVSRAAAENMVPVTLELGGKSPVIVGDSAKLEQVAKSCAFGKTFNAGQICLAPDYVLIREQQVDPLVTALRSAIQDAYPTMRDNPDYTSVINERHRDRLAGYLDDAKEKGATIVEINPADEDFASQDSHKMPFYVILNATEDMTVMREEIFGPLLPVKTCQNIDEAIQFVNSRPHPLSLYYFGYDRDEQEQVVDQTMAGGMTINDVIWHYGQEEMPFGGVGESGMGAYHGYEGFKNFSHAKSVFRQARFDIPRLLGMYAPYGEKFDKLMKSQIKK